MNDNYLKVQKDGGYMNYKEVYTKNYFDGKETIFWKFGYGKFGSLYFNTTFRPIAEYIKKIKTGRVLDVGCAYGFMLQRFPNSFQKFGVDVSEYAVGIARERLPSATFKIMGAEEKLPFEKNFFDIILLNDVLEHLENPKIALKNIWRVLKKGGILYITTPNLNIVRKKIFRNSDKKVHHISLFPHSNLFSLLNSMGFKIVEHWTFINLIFYLRFRSNLGIESAFICKK